ncbi:MAG: S41 family peptidase [Bacteroidales bacterium]|nr:S41 family peptidase [Bacteroidales bacterium]
MKRIIFHISLLLVSITGVFAQGMQTAASRKLSFAQFAIQNLYVDKLDENKLTEDAIEGMLKKLDPHSNYMNPQEVKEMNEPLQGNFEGIGIQFNMLNDTLFVIQTISAGPSEKVGIVAGDRIIMVNDTSIAGKKMKTTDIMKRLKGPKGTVVNVKVMRRNTADLIDFRIVRDKIPIYSLDASYMVNKKIGYIRINRFGATTYDEFMTALTALQLQGMKSLILDLEDNGGGYLKAAIDIADEFLKKNELIVYTEGVHQSKEESFAGDKGTFHEGKLVVLINESSASASEIVTGALQDWDRAVVVGRRSFGKGLVQRPIPLPDNSMIRLTIARYYTPTGRCIQKPYEDGIEKYSKDLIDRYNKGEMAHADSIHFPDSLKTYTKVNRRVVYGGGGIMPDIFVPIDTSRYTNYHRDIVAKGVMNKFTISYIDMHRAELKQSYPKIDDFVTKFNVSDEILNGLVTAAEGDKIKPDSAQFEKAKPLISTQLKALMARDLFDMTAYFRVMNAENETFQKGVDILQNERQYAKLLLGKKK